MRAYAPPGLIRPKYNSDLVHAVFQAISFTKLKRRAAVYADAYT